MYFVKTPNSIQRWFSDYIWRFSTSKKELFLTFDDGPNPEITTFVLDILAKYNAKATFFCVGENAIKHPKIFKRILAEGHKIGNHTQNHLNGWKTENTNYIANVGLAEKSFNTVIPNFKTKLFRPPYGKIKKKQATALQNKGYEIIMWTVLSGDFDINCSPKKCYNNIIKNAKSGNIIVFHDSRKAKKNMQETLVNILAYYSNKGFKFKLL